MRERFRADRTVGPGSMNVHSLTVDCAKAGMMPPPPGLTGPAALHEGAPADTFRNQSILVLHCIPLIS